MDSLSRAIGMDSRGSLGPDLDASLAEVHRNLGIPGDYGFEPRRPRHFETRELVVVDEKARGRQQRLMPQAASAWRGMQQAAQNDGILLQLVSSFRSVAHQAAVIERQLKSGRSIEEILTSVAAPGFSEHHTGRALDINTSGCEPLTEAFEGTKAFAWLSTNARHWEFVMSYPRNNPYGFVYEPWHWAHGRGSVSASPAMTVT